MKYNKLDKLLYLLNYNTNVYNNIKFWKLASLISLGRSYEGNSLKLKLESFINKQISNEDFEKWLLSNSIDFLSNSKWSTIKQKSIINTAIENKIYYISLQPMSDSDRLLESFKIKESSMLQPYKEIPKLFLCEVKFISNLKLTNLDKELAEYNFIVEPLFKFFRLNLDQVTIQAIKNFISNNKSKISEILNIGTTIPRPVGCGIDGCAFSISDNLILKIFKDKQLYNKSLETINRLHKEPQLANTEAMIYDVGELGKFEFAQLKIPIYYYIMEKMKPVSTLNQNTIENIYDLIKSIVHLFYENKQTLKQIKNDLENKILDQTQIKEEINIYKKTLSEEVRKTNIEDINKIENNIDLSSDWLESLVEEILVKYLTGRTDLHIGNLGISKYKKLRYFDPYHQNHTSEIVYFNN